MVGEADVEEAGVVGEHGVGQQFEEGQQHEGSLVHAGVGDGEAVVGDRQVVEQQDVDVDRSRAPADVSGAAQRRLHAVDGVEEVEGLEVGVDLRDDVQEVGLVGTTDGIRLPDPRRALRR